MGGIIGIGHDVIELERIRDLLSGRLAERFMRRLWTEGERKLAEEQANTANTTPSARLVEYAAGRFAAKEAVAKAFGCGIGGMLGFHDMEIRPDKAGKPHVHIRPEALSKLGHEKDGIRLHLSITHTATLASAFVIIEKLS